MTLLIVRQLDYKYKAGKSAVNTLREEILSITTRVFDSVSGRQAASSRSAAVCSHCKQASSAAVYEL